MVLSGLDPYDALRSSLGRLARTALTRQVLTQARKRLPIPNKVWGVQPFVMAKTIGCVLTASARRQDQDGILHALDALPRAAGALGGGAYGYEFDVQTRWAFYPSGTPNLIATVFAARGLGTVAVVTQSDEVRREMSQSAEFLYSTLFAVEPEPFFRYTLTSDRLVHNANLLGAGLCAMAGVLERRDELTNTSLMCANTSISAQRPDGSWPYGDADSLDWSDNFHTAYNLDGLLQVWLATGDPGVHASLAKGVGHWVRDFFGPDGEPKYYPHKAYPYDIHSAGTAVDVASRLATWGWDTADLAERVAFWTKKNLVDSSTGQVYYQKHRWWTDKRHFVRWGAAHWALGQSSLALMREGRRDPLEQAVASKGRVVAHDC